MATSVMRPASTPVDRLQFETLLSDISAKLVTVGHDEVDAAVATAIDDVRRFFGADRCALCHISDDRRTIRFSHIAAAEGVSNVLGDLDLTTVFPWVGRRVAVDLERVALSRLDDLPAEAARDRASFEARGTQAMLCIPVPAGPVKLHAILLSVVRSQREWPEEYVPRLRLLGEIFVDALERANAEAGERAATDALRESEALNRATFEQAAVGIAHVGTDGAWLRVNDRLCAIVGYTREELTGGMTFQDITHPDDVARDLDYARDVLSGVRSTFAMEKRYRRRDGSLVWINLTVSLVRTVDGRPRHFIAVVEDITDRWRALEELKQLRERLERENVYLRHEATRRLGPEYIVGRSAAIRRTLALAEQVAPTDSGVLLLGETGSGKERFASYLHECSRRRDRPMITVNCSAIPTTLIESELFGREKGAYTGALSKQAGRFELAHNSTLFLDEIGELSAEIQVKLLRVLETHTIERLGNPRPVSVDVRIIAGTHRDLAADVRAGRFREDLYYRLCVFPIEIPPLRDRREDIPLLVQAFVDEFAGTMGRRFDDVDAASLKAMVGYAWPGNVRELRNVIERAMIMGSGGTLRIDMPASTAPPADAAKDLAAVDRAHIRQILQDTGWRIRGTRGAAALLKLKPTTLESRIKRLGLARPGSQPR
jgi:formate hydrogenlyase transcriptional activator